MSEFQLRFGLDQKEMTAIYTEPEIAQKMNEFLAKTHDETKDLVLVMKKLLGALPNDELTKEEIKASLISDNKIINQFQDTLMSKVLHSAIQKALTSGFYDIKQNIIDMLSGSDDSLQKLSRECMVTTVSSLTQFDYDDILRETFL